MFSFPRSPRHSLWLPLPDPFSDVLRRTFFGLPVCVEGQQQARNPRAFTVVKTQRLKRCNSLGSREANRGGNLCKVLMSHLPGVEFGRIILSVGYCRKHASEQVLWRSLQKVLKHKSLCCPSNKTKDTHPEN